MFILPHDYIRGLVEGEGTFTFSTTSRRSQTGVVKKIKVPAFAIKMHERDEELLRAVRNTLGLTNRIYKYNHQGKDGSKRGAQAMLIVREFPQLKNIIIPFFYNKLRGNKGKQFLEWLERLEGEEMSEKSHFLYRLYKSGFFDKS